MDDDEYERMKRELEETRHTVAESRENLRAFKKKMRINAEEEAVSDAAKQLARVVASFHLTKTKPKRPRKTRKG